MSSDQIARMEAALRETFQPTRLLVKDQSHLHAGHAGARDGMGHYEVQIVSETFAGQSRLGRHRMVYEALDDMMQTDIHALKIQALTPGET